MTEPNELPRAYGPDMAGRYWVPVSPEMARRHPKGRPGIVLHAIAVWFVFWGVVQFVALGWSLWLPLAVLRVFAGIGLALGAPYARALAVLLFLVGLFGIPPIEVAEAETMAASIGLRLAPSLVELGMVWYLFDGERPNLVYAHRYRSYRAEAQVSAAAREAKK